MVHGRKLGRALGATSAAHDDGFRTLNLRFSHPKPAARASSPCWSTASTSAPLPGVASLGMRPTVDDSGRVLLETHCLEWPAALGAEGGYGKLVRVELLHKLHDEARYDGLDALTAAIASDAADARAWFAAHGGAFAATGRQTTRDRI